MKTKITRTFKQLFLFFPILLCFTGSAATYYVSSTGGDDSNSGLSASNPWKTLWKVTTIRTFRPGDRILLKAGDKFDGPLIINNSGIHLNPIRIGRYGSGANPIIYGDHPSSTWSAVAGHPGVYVTDTYGGTIKDVYGSDGAFYPKYDRGTLSLDEWLKTMPVNTFGADIRLKTTYIKLPSRSVPPVVHMYEFTVVQAYKGYVVFENLDVRNGYNGISVGGTGVIVKNNTISDMIYHGIYMPSAVNNEVGYNRITRTGETCLTLRSAENSWVHHNTISNTIGTILGVPIVLRRTVPERCGIGMMLGNNNLIEYNSISNTQGSFFDFFYEANTVVRYNYGFRANASASPHGTGLKVYSNIFNMDSKGKGLASTYFYDLTKNPAAEPKPNLIFNNIIYDFKNYGLYSGRATGLYTGKHHTIFRNNIVKTTSDSELFVTVAPGTSSDYNCFYSTSGGSTKNGWNFGDPGGGKAGYATIEAFRSGTGLETYSFFGDPKFQSSRPVIPNDFKLKASSPCVTKGQNLKTARLFLENYADYAGISFVQSSTPSIGAFETVGATSTIGTNLNSNVSAATPEMIVESTESSAYPNPASSSVKIQSREPITVNKNIVVFDAGGKAYGALPTNRISAHAIELTVSSLSPGVYLVRLQTDAGYRIVRFAKL